jgi:hypothetical protein
MSFIKARKEKFLILYPAKCQVRDEAPDVTTEGVIMHCLARAVAHFRG